MTNDVAIIKEYLINSANSQEIEKNVKRQPVDVSPSYRFKAGDIVVHNSSDKELRIYKVRTDGCAVCLDNEKDTMVGAFSVTELKLIQEYKGK